MPTETIYQPPDGEGPSVVATVTCNGCVHLVRSRWVSEMPGNERSYCQHPRIVGTGFIGHGPTPTPSWCPIVQASPEEWAKRMGGGECTQAAEE